MENAVADNLPEAGRLPLRAFLRRPVAPIRATGIGMESLRGVLRLYGVDFAAMSVLGIIAMAVVAAGFELPTNTLNEMELAPGFIAFVVLGAPFMEELAFRSWLSGRPGHIVASALGAAAIFLAPAAVYADGAAATAGLGALTALLLALAGAALWRWRRRGPMPWFTSGFPVIFWLVALVFGAVHLTNYQDGALYILLPLVIPQFVAGTLFGYARVQYGLWAAILLHMMHNGTAVALVLLMAQTGLPAG